jgi:UDP-N-acetyl-D-glucosamine dehydrogenase
MPKSKPIAVIGLGYVGLPLGLHFVKAGQPVIGFDTDTRKVEQINAGQSYIGHISSERIAGPVKTGTFSATSDFEQLRECDAILICVPTPLTSKGEPDISFILNTGHRISRHLQRGQLVVLESTTYPGTTDTELREVLERGSGLKAGEDFHLAFSPEREDPGNPQSNMPEIPKVIGGYTPACLKRAMEVYGKVIRTLVPVSSCRVAEATKLTENIFRAVNIAMVNELKMVYGAMGIDIWEVINAAKTKPFGYMPFFPGPGWGGHCVPIDPFYLTWKAREFGQETQFIRLAGEINTAMPNYVLLRIEDALKSQQKKVSGSRILLLGVAYKADVDDDRESPSYVLWKLLEKAGARVEYHDPHVPTIRPSREHSQFAGRTSVPLTADTLANFDAVVIVTAHKAADYALIAKNAKLIIDTRNALAAFAPDPTRYFKA